MTIKRSNVIFSDKLSKHEEKLTIFMGYFNLKKIILHYIFEPCQLDIKFDTQSMDISIRHLRFFTMVYISYKTTFFQKMF